MIIGQIGMLVANTLLETSNPGTNGGEPYKTGIYGNITPLPGPVDPNRR